MTKSKKDLQLGMSASTAQHRLLKDILWNLVKKTNQHICCKCNKDMERDNFSIEHVVPWLDSHDPISLFFDLENISFSHITCNIGSARRTHQVYMNNEDRDNATREINRNSKRRNYSPEKRKEKYLSKGY